MAVDALRPSGPAGSGPAGSADDTALEVGRWRSWFSREGLLVLLASGYGAVLLALAGRLVSTDSWYALVGGRVIAQHGLPSHNTLTLWAHGARWIDQQWLAQLTIYGLDRVGGLRLAVIVHILLLVAAFAGAIVLARRRGSDPRSVAIVSAVALPSLTLSSAQLRTQSFGYVLFVAVVALLTRSGPIGWRRLLLLLGIVVLWANLHGSAVLAAGLISLRGLAEVKRGFGTGRRLKQVGWLVAALPWPSLLLTPYLLSTTSYYSQTIFNPTLSHYLAQWQPSTLSILSLPLFALALGFLWLLGRAGSAYTGFEKIAGLALVAFALLAVRNWVWLGLFAVAFYPKAIDRIRSEARRVPHESRLNGVFGVAGIAIALLAFVPVLTHRQSWFARDFPSTAARAVAGIANAHPGARIWATEQWADWLLWQDPRLEGRLAFDARVELLSAAQVKRMVVFSATPLLIPQVRRRYAILVVSKTNEPDAYRTLRRDGPVVYDNGNVLVVSSLKGSA
jgi:hypothetical protein